MFRNYKLSMLAFTMVHSALALAGTMGEERAYDPVIGVFGGPAWFNTNMDSTQTYLGASNDIFLYVNNSNSQATGFVGAFVGVEQAKTQAPVFFQVGIEYDYFAPMTISGMNYVGVEPATFTTYSFSWKVQSQQVLGDLKALFPINVNFTGIKTFYPYAMVGIGVGTNRAYSFSEVTSDTGSLNVPPTLNNQTTSTFTYNVGAGVEVPCTEHFRIGVGYRYSDFGQAGLSSAVVVFNQYQQPMPLTILANKLYANQFIAQLSYVV